MKFEKLLNNEYCWIKLPNTRLLSLKTNNMESVSPSLIMYRKLKGCYLEFGFFEVIKRITKELSRRGRLFNHQPDASPLKDNFSIGAAPKSEPSLGWLLSDGYNQIIDLRAERKSNDILMNSEEITVHWIPTYDDWLPKSKEFFEKLTRELQSILSVLDNKLFICCGAGEHRAPLAGAVALIENGHSIEDAINIIKTARPVAEFLPVYVSSLKKFYGTK